VKNASLNDADRQTLSSGEPAPTSVLPIDQAVLIVAATIRNDRYQEMQDHSTVGEINSVLFNELKPMPPSQFKEVITRPSAPQRTSPPACAILPRSGGADLGRCSRRR
jgi:hypothetical protein